MAPAAHGAQGCAHGDEDETMRTSGSNTTSNDDGGALALIAICGMIVAFGLLTATVERLGALVPMVRTVAVQATH
jgi:hypothetical protein